jgi:hypothetical protein
VGPVIDGNGLSVEAFQADGTTSLGVAQVGAAGSFSITVGEYTGTVVLRVVDADDGEDHLDEATGANQDLNAALSASYTVDGATATVSDNDNPLTTLAAALAAREAGEATPTPAQVDQANAAIADLFRLTDLHGTTVEPINGGAFDASDGLSAAEHYGAMLAAFSGASLNNGGDSQQTIDEVLAEISISSTGQAVLSESGHDLLIDGARTAEEQSGESLSDVVTLALDHTPPEITSGENAATIAENSGPGQPIYSATAENDGPVTWSLATTGDAASFSIDSATGEVSLSADPDFETQSSYTFTVVATDIADNSSERTVTLAIGNLDEVAPPLRGLLRRRAGGLREPHGAADGVGASRRAALRPERHALESRRARRRRTRGGGVDPRPRVAGGGRR